MHSFNEVWRHFGLILGLDFFSLLCCSSEIAKPAEETQRWEFENLLCAISCGVCLHAKQCRFVSFLGVLHVCFCKSFVFLVEHCISLWVAVVLQSFFCYKRVE